MTSSRLLTQPPLKHTEPTAARGTLVRMQSSRRWMLFEQPVAVRSQCFDLPTLIPRDGPVSPNVVTLNKAGICGQSLLP